jgi:hypothetical protein
LRNQCSGRKRHMCAIEMRLTFAVQGHGWKQGDQIGRFFCLFGDYFLWAAFLKITELAQTFGLLTLYGKSNVLINFDKNEFGYIFRRFLRTHLVTLAEKEACNFFIRNQMI